MNFRIVSSQVRWGAIWSGYLSSRWNMSQNSCSVRPSSISVTVRIVLVGQKAWLIVSSATRVLLVTKIQLLPYSWLETRALTTADTSRQAKSSVLATPSSGLLRIKPGLIITNWSGRGDASCLTSSSHCGRYRSGGTRFKELELSILSNLVIRNYQTPDILYWLCHPSEPPERPASEI